MKTVNLNLGLKVFSANAAVFVDYLKEAKRNGLTLDVIINELGEQVAQVTPLTSSIKPVHETPERRVTVRVPVNSILTPLEIAKAADVQLSTVYYWIDKNHLHHTKLGGRYTAKVQDVNRFFSKKGIPAINITETPVTA